jgi:SAM-dependent methyltransferase
VSVSIHHAAAGGFGSAAEKYERSRPDYPDESVRLLARELRLSPGRQAMDLGAGTGKLTRMLTGTGASLVAVEPVEAMRRRFAQVVPEVPVVGGTAEALPFRDGTFDAVVCAQAFHWFDAEGAMRAIHAVLRPGGRLGLVWNTRDESVDWVKQMSDVLRPYESKEPGGGWRDAFARTTLFGRLHERRFSHRQDLDVEGLVERVASVSFIAILPDAERAGVLGRIRSLAETHPALAGRSRFVLPYVTKVYWCERS